MTRSGEAAAAALMVAGLLLTSACDSDKPPTPLPTTAATSSPTASSPTAPAPAKTAAGAEAFTRYFWDTINYAYATYDTTLLRGATTDECDFCKGTIDVVDSVRMNDRTYEGSRIEVASVHASPPLAGGAFVVTTNLSQSSGVLKGADGAVLKTSPALPPSPWGVRTEWQSERWVVVGVAEIPVQPS